MLAHSFDRFYVVTKFILPLVNDLNFSPVDFDAKCSYLNQHLSRYQNAKQHVSNLKMYCEYIVPFIDFYRKQISSYNYTAHKILMNEMYLILPNLAKDRKEKRIVTASLVTGFIDLVYEGISSYLLNKRQMALNKAFMAMENEINLQHNKTIHLENSVVMYGIHNLESLEKLIDTVHKIHNSTT